MGAHDISFELDGNKTFQDVLQAFRDRQASDAAENGRQSGYSGDFQTVHSVENHSNKVFDTHNEAMEYCLQNATKWESVIAVKVKISDKPKPTKTLSKLRDAYKALGADMLKLQDETLEAFKKNRAESQFLKCSNCKSRLAARYLSEMRADCPACGESLAPKGLVKACERLQAKRTKLGECIAALEKQLQAKAAANSKKSSWLVAGWGAC